MNGTNSALMNRTNSCEPVNNLANTFFIVLYSVMFLVILNGFTLRVYFCVAQHRPSSSVTIYLKNLAASDFLISLCLPLRIMNFASNSTLIRQVYCNFGAAAFYLNMYASILFMGFIAIVHPLGNHFFQKARAAYIISISTWGLLLAMTSSYVSQYLKCISLKTDLGLHWHNLTVFLNTTLFLNTSAAVLFSSGLALKRFLRSRSDPKLSQDSRRVVLSVTTMALAYMLSFVPYHVLRTPYTLTQNDFIKNCNTRRQLFLGKESTLFLSLLHVCLDPLLFFNLDAPFRVRVRRLLPCSRYQAAIAEEQVVEEEISQNGDGKQDAAYNNSKYEQELT
uniref:G-protein coupled receptors family 1 profile domain-containing protein n=1 Tax=Cyprinodon variegatus TaxID=28743 RepID=A0A3Q2CLA1_CYPVA